MLKHDTVYSRTLEPCLHGTAWSRSVSGFNLDSVV